jgi:hypothetical protein
LYCSADRWLACAYPYPYPHSSVIDSEILIPLLPRVI